MSPPTDSPPDNSTASSLVAHGQTQTISTVPLSLVENEIEYLVRLIRKTLIHKLVDDILLHIFLILVQDCGRFYNYPWKLMTVCRRWRNLCLRHPQLWSYIDVSIPGHICEEDTSISTAYASAIGLQLKRSRDTKLFVSMGRRLCDCVDQVTIFRDVAFHSHRWAEFHLATHQLSLRHFGPPSSPFAGLSPQDVDFSNLECLRWEDRSEMRICADSTTLISLRHATFRHTDPTADTAFPWRQLTSLALTDYRGSDSNLVSALSKCHNLDTLDLNFTNLSRETGGGTPPTVVHLPKVISAGFVGAGGLGIVPYLKLPSLRRLCARQIGQDDAQNIHDLLLRSSCSLINLHLETESDTTLVQQVGYSKVLERCPSLETLTLRNSKSLYHDDDMVHRNHVRDDVLVTSLTQKKGHETCPTLKTLKLVKLIANPALLWKMLESRLETTPSLKAIEISFPRHVDYEDYPEPDPSETEEFLFCKTLLETRLQAYIANGLDFRMSLGEFD